jgi:drug/metabolite transporter (DMT)-like permease
MQPELFIALLAGVGGMLGWGLADFFAKKTIDAVGDVVSLVWAHIFGTMVLCALAVYHYGINGNALTLPTADEWLLLIFFGALQAAVYLFVYAGFAKGQVAVLSPIFASFSGLVALASVFFLGEALSVSLLFVLSIIFIGVMLSSIDVHTAIRGSFITAPGVREVVIATILATAWTLLWDVFVGGADWIFYTLAMYAFMTVVMYVIARARKISLTIRSTHSHVWKFLFLIGACEIIAYLAISYGYSLTSLTSVVAVLSGAFSLPVIILARIFLKERPTMTQTVGSIVVVLGVILLPLI